MALKESDADTLARKLILAMAESGTIKTNGPATSGAAGEDQYRKKGRLDAVYLASLYRDLVAELQN